MRVAADLEWADAWRQGVPRVWRHENGLFIWWSGNTLANGRGSFMAYRSVGRRATAMYVELERSGDRGTPESWRIVRSLGMDASDVRELIELPLNCQRV